MAPFCFSDNDYKENEFFVSPDDGWQNYHCLGSTFANSPEQLPQSLPPGPSFQPSSPIYLPVHEAHHPASFAVAPPNPSVHTPFQHGRPLQTDLQPVLYHAVHDAHHSASFAVAPPNPSVHTSFHHGRPLQTDLQPVLYHAPIQQASAPLDAGRSDLRGYSSLGANGSSPVIDRQYPSTYGQPHYNDSRMFVSQDGPFHTAMGISHPQMQPAPASVVQISSPIRSDSASQLSPTRRNSRRSRPGIRSPYHPTRTPSLPVQSVSPKEMTPHTCKWVRDGVPCGAQITWADLPQHLITHNVKNLAHDFRLSCGWLGCKLRGDKAKMNRESILRHVRETHMGYRRVSS